MSNYKNKLSKYNQCQRFIFSDIWFVLARPLPRSLCMPWKRFILRIFGAKIHATANIYSSARIYIPSNLIMHEYSCIDMNVNCYNVDKIIVGANSTISQGAFLCTASHDITNTLNPLITAPIVIKDQAWIASDAFVGMGVVVGQGAVVGARVVVFKNVDSCVVVGGHPP